jgi:uncharacterized protein (TIGR02001 family)
LYAIGLAIGAVPDAAAEPRERWTGPFGGELHAFVTLATDYAKSGISSSENQPVFQAGIDWHSPYLLQNGPPLRLYVTAFGSTVSFPSVGPGEEVDLSAGLKLRPVKALSLDLGYIRYLFPTYAADRGFEYGEYSLKADYDFGPLTVSGRLRYSPDTIGHAGRTWEKRGLVSVPLDFLPLPDGLKLKTYGALGNTWVEKPDVLGLTDSNYWFWQGGLVLSFLGLDLTLAYTDTNIEAVACGNTRACAGRFFAAISKVF